MNSTVQWHWRSFEALSNSELRAVFKLRQDVFILEQQCLYADIDDLDQHCWHLLGMQKTRLAAYLRCIPPGLHYRETAIGRVVVASAVRRQGLAQRLMQHGIRHALEQYPRTDIRLNAQVYLQSFYRSLGFAPVSDEYLEDGIPHIEMLLQHGQVSD